MRKKETAQVIAKIRAEVQAARDAQAEAEHQVDTYRALANEMGENFVVAIEENEALQAVIDRLTLLPPEIRNGFRSIWKTVACMYCGNVHPGLCPRVVSFEQHPNGSLARAAIDLTKSLPHDTIYASQVFGYGGLADKGVDGAED